MVLMLESRLKGNICHSIGNLVVDEEKDKAMPLVRVSAFCFIHCFDTGGWVAAPTLI